MTFASRARKIMGASVAVLLVAGTLSVAPLVVSTASASNSSNAKSILSKLNGYRTAHNDSQFRTQSSITAFAQKYAANFAKVGRFGTPAVPSPLPIDGYNTSTVTVIGVYGTPVSSNTPANIAKYIKDNRKTSLYGDFNYAGSGYVTKDGTGYSVVVLLDYADLISTPVTPKISGTAKVGSRLSASVSGWSPSNAAFTYQWSANGNPVGTNSRTFTPTPSLYGQKIKVTVTGVRSGWSTVSRTSAASKSVVNGTITAKTPTISGSRVVGSTLTAKPGTWAPSNTAFTYKWLRNGTTIPGATQATYTLTSSDRAKRIDVKVTGSSSRYTSVTKSSTATKTLVLGAFTKGTPAILGASTAIGSTFTAANGAWSPTPTTYSYQWYLGASAISKATAKTYKSKASDQGKTLTVKVTVTKSGYKSASAVSAGRVMGATPTR